MSERHFEAYQQVDYVYVINRLLMRIVDIGSGMRDRTDFDEFISSLHMLYRIMIPRIRPREAGELLRIASNGNIDETERLKACFKALELMIDALDRNGLLLKGTWLEAGRKDAGVRQEGD